MLRYVLPILLLTAAPAVAQTVEPTGAQRPAVRRLPGLPLDSATYQISFRGSLPVPGVPRAELYGRAQEWVARHFEQYGAVVQLASPERGVLLGRALTQAYGPAQKNLDARSFTLLFLFSFRAQDGALRYELTDISYPRYAATSVVGDASSARLADGLVEWLRQDAFSAIGTTAAQTHRIPVEPALRSYDQYNDRGEPRPRMVQQCQGIQEAMTTLLASLQQSLSHPRP
ncbi:DUF4468 domain-containing protein [Hymenobacter weizhouensis]|uniref:DUF4468 domain-containing protein n=1 Tax=Hymenobacter sp. YIM 151500-1 TaxID=2987689 RepID=UPI002227E8AB|nr:DUF4468 domain-containing protein [Hymenobacter sp. YIM 151500-1]UYZ62017.1 DUF4468 domain-containing protein [Hymenobacter sp. YIM 151500-1]